MKKQLILVAFSGCLDKQYPGAVVAGDCLFGRHLPERRYQYDMDNG